MRRIRTGPSFAFTREGRVFVLLTLGVGLGAVNTGNNLLYLVLGLMLGLWLTSGVLSEIVLRGIEIQRMSPPRLFASSLSLLEYEVSNTKRWLSSTSFEIADVIDAETITDSGYVLKLEAGANARVVLVHTPAHRGVLRFTHLRVRTRFPFGILEKTRTRRSESSALVFPHIDEVALPPRDNTRVGHEEPRDRSGYGSEIVGVREQRDGDSLRDVHWRRTAALGRTMVRDRAEERDEELDISLAIMRSGARARDDAKDAGPANSLDRAFERDVSRCASLAAAAIAVARPVVLRTEDGILARATSRAELDDILRALALIEARTPAEQVTP